MNRFLKRLAAGFAVLAAITALLIFSLPLPGNIPVLMYHFIGSSEEAALNGNWVSRESFAAQMAFLKKFNYRVLTMEEYAAIKSGKRKPQGREVLITFDDGHQSFKNDAYPILKKHKLPAVMFLVSDFVKNGRQEGHSDSLNQEEILQLAKTPGITFEAHTRTHPHLKEITEIQLKEELEGSKKELEVLLGKPMNFFAYPFGELNQPLMDAVKAAGYKLAFSTGFKKLEAIPEGPYSLTRSKISESSSNLIVFWYHVSGTNRVVKSLRQKIKYGI